MNSLDATVPTISLPHDVQKLSVQLLDIPRMNVYIKQAPSYQEKQIRPWEEYIYHIIEIYNQKAAHQFELQSKLSPEGCFSRIIYRQPKKSKTRLTAKIESIAPGKKLSKKSDTNFILFFFRYQPNEAFAVTSGPSWQVVRPCINYHFTTRVALKILDPNRITKITRRCLVGSNVQETLINPAGHELCKTSNLYYLVESFIAAIKPGASIIGCFERHKQKPPKNITVSTGLLRFDKEMPLEIYPSLLEWLSNYNNEHHTYAYKHPQWVLETEDPGFEFLKFLEEEHALTPVLNQCLINKFNYGITNMHRQLNHLVNFTVRNCSESKKLRGVAATWKKDNHTLYLIFYFNGPISEEDIRMLKMSSLEFFTSLTNFWKIVTFDGIILTGYLKIF